MEKLQQENNSLHQNYHILNTNEKIKALRGLMKREGIHAFITPSTDPHAGEYVPERWKARQWISGFTGSAGTAVVTLDKAALWTDSRYFIQAAEQLADTEYVLMKEKIEGTPSITEWLSDVLPEGSVVAVDGWVNTTSEVKNLENELKAHRLKFLKVLDHEDDRGHQGILRDLENDLPVRDTVLVEDRSDLLREGRTCQLRNGNIYTDIVDLDILRTL